MKILLVLFFLSASLLHAQQWVSRYEGGQNDYGNSIAVDGLNNSYVAGTTETTGLSSSVLILKYNSAGVQQWAEVYVHSFPILYSFGTVIRYDNAGSLYIGGGIYKMDSTEAIIILKYSTSGSMIWSKTFDTPGEYNYFSDLTLDDQGNPYLLGGYFDTMGSGGSEVIRYNIQGDTLWTSRYEGATTTDIKADEFGNSYVTGGIFDNTNLFECLTYKLDQNGNLMWGETNGSTGFDFGHSLCINQSGEVYVTGIDGFLEDVFLIKYDPDGLVTWLRNYNSPENYEDRGTIVNLDNADNIYVAGTTDYNDSLRRILVLKYGPAGNLIWDENFSDTSNLTSISDMLVSGEGKIYVTGSSAQGPDRASIISFIYNTTGMLEWQTQYTGPDQYDYSSAIAIDINKNIYITGSSVNDSGNYSCLTLKYNNPVNISTISSGIPGSFSLAQNYPNPFNPVTNLEFGISTASLLASLSGQGAKSGFVSLKVYDILGKEVAVLVDSRLNPGVYKYQFNGSNLTSGIYFYKLEAGNFSETKKMSLIK